MEKNRCSFLYKKDCWNDTHVLVYNRVESRNKGGLVYGSHDKIITGEKGST